METRIEKTADSSLLAELNKDVQELHVRKYPDLFKPCDNSAVRQFFDSLVQQPHWFHFVAYRGDVPVGFIQVERRELKDHPFRRDGVQLYIHQICVRNEHAGKGYGRQLIDHAKQLAKEMNIHRLELDVWSLNQRANDFFLKSGFETVNRRMATTTWGGSRSRRPHESFTIGGDARPGWKLWSLPAEQPPSPSLARAAVGFITSR